MKIKAYIWIFLCLSLFLQGCTTLRKKFVRQKKQDQKESFVPVLDPIDYPEPRKDPAQRYAYHYAMWKIWMEDLLKSMDQDTNKKRHKYFFEKMLSQLQQMRSWLNGARQQELDVFLEDFRRIQEDFLKPVPSRSVFSIKKRIQRLSSSIRRQFHPSFMRDNGIIGH